MKKTGKKAQTPAGNKGPGRLGWFVTLLAAGCRQAVYGFARSLYGVFWDVGRWMFSVRGLAFTCILAVFVFLAGLMVLDSLLTRPPETAEQSENDQNAETIAANPVLATVNGRALRLSGVIEFARQEQLAGSGELTLEEVYRRDLVDVAVDQLLVSAKARQEGLPSDPATRARLRTAERRILYADYLQKVIEEEATEEKALAIYDAQRENLSFGDEVRVRRLVVQESEQAIQLSNALRQGVDFEELVQNFSADPKFGDQGGDMGYLAFEQMPDGHAGPAFETARGQVSLPFETEEGWVILKVLGRRKISMPGWEESREDILKFLAERAVADRLARLREEAEVTVYPAPPAASEQDATVLPETGQQPE